MGWKGQVMNKKELLIALVGGMSLNEKTEFLFALLDQLTDDAVFDWLDATIALPTKGGER